MSYRLFVSEDRCTLFRVFEATDEHGEIAEVALRDHPSHTWGPPIKMVEEAHDD